MAVSIRAAQGSWLGVRLAAAFLTVCFAACHTPRPEPLAPPAHTSRVSLGAGAPLRYLVLGDSTAAGVGADYEHGIVMGTTRHLAESRRVELLNLAVSGARFRDVLREQLPRVNGFHPNLVLLDVGANDVTHLTSSGTVRRQLEDILQSVSSLACDARIVVTGAPDMGSPPRIPFFLRSIAAWRARRINAIATDAARSHALTFAPIAERTGPAFRGDRTLFASDRFHPNARGYALWTPVLNEALDAALAGQPVHCPP